MTCLPMCDLLEDGVNIAPNPEKNIKRSTRTSVPYPYIAGTQTFALINRTGPKLLASVERELG